MEFHHLTLDTLPPSHFDNHPVIEPLLILDCKWDTSHTTQIQKVLVQWLGLPLEDTSWEKWNFLRHVYNLGDKVTLLEQGIDSKKAHENSRPKRTHHALAYLHDYA